MSLNNDQKLNAFPSAVCQDGVIWSGDEEGGVEYMTIATKTGAVQPLGGRLRCQESGCLHLPSHPVTLKLLQFPASCSFCFIFLFHRRERVFSCCKEVSRVDVSEDFSGKLLAFSIQLHRGAEVSKKVSAEDVVCDICCLDFEAFTEMK